MEKEIPFVSPSGIRFRRIFPASREAVNMLPDKRAITKMERKGTRTPSIP
ncbi:hypothetical protein [Parablautia intestinalis]|nr:hypothetical protein [Parablautia intestinalis]